MSWRIVKISSNSKLDYKLGCMVVRNEAVKKIHLSEISLLIIESTAVSITGALLSEMVKKKIKIIFCDDKRDPISELLPYYGSYDTSNKIRQQITWTGETKLIVWAEIVREKIKKQRNLLIELDRGEEELLHEYMNSVLPGDSTNREGHAAKVYFNAIYGKDFTRTEESATNAALNYGYTIMLSSFNREIVSNGYITQLGIFHNNMFNQFNLGSDLMEPFRILVDRKVLEMEPEKLENEEKMELINILNEEVYINNQVTNVMNSIKIYVKSVLDAINDNDISNIRFYRNEL